MAFTDLRFKAGINKEITPYSEENGWVDCDKIRFRFGYPEKLNGWVKNSARSFLGICRGLHNWRALSGESFLGLGTQVKYYIQKGLDFKDVTPLRLTSTGNVTFSATNGSSTITVSNVEHRCVVGDFVTFSGAASLGGNITAAILNQEYQVTSVVDGNTYKISARTVSTISSITVDGALSPTLVTANSSDTGNGNFQDSTVDTTNGDATCTMDSTSSLVVGSSISGTGIPANTTVASITDATTFELSANANATNTNITATINSTVAAYQVSVGLNTAVPGTGWGAGLWGGINNAANQTTLNGAITDAAATTITLSSAASIVAGDIVMIGEELILVGGISSDDITGCTRGHQNTVAATHANGAVVRLTTGNSIAANDFNGWGEGVNTGVLTSTSGLRIWSHDNFQEDLIFNERHGQIYFWDKTNGVATRGVELSTLTFIDFLGNTVPCTSVPQKCSQILLSDRDRHVIAFGADGLGATSSATKGNGIQDPMLIRFASQETPVDWFPTDTNTAGDLRIDAGSQIVQAIETRQQIVVITDVAVYAMQFIGPPFFFGINLVSSNITIASPKAAVAVNDIVYWMGSGEFYSYGGSVQRIPCTVKDYVFDNIDNNQIEKVVAGSNVSFAEIWWFYPSSGSTENDRYVVYNYQENIWFIGNLGRTAWLDRGVGPLPLGAGSDYYLFNHETGSKADTVAMTSFIESGDMDISGGDQFSFISRVIPDLKFRESVDDGATQVDFIFTAKNAPGQVAQSTETDTVNKTISNSVGVYTNQYQTRLRGRSFTFKVQSTDLNVLWRLGTPRIDIRSDGRR